MRKYRVYLDGKFYSADEVLVDEGGHQVFLGKPPDLHRWFADLPMGHKIGPYTKVSSRHVRYEGATSALILVDTLQLHLLREIG